MKAVTLGAEIEKPLSNKKTKKPHKISGDFFRRIAREREKQKSHVKFKYSDIAPEVVLGVADESFGEIGLDNGFNLQETSTRVIRGHDTETALFELRDLLLADLTLVQQAAEAEGASVVNASNHPLGSTKKTAYKHFVAPKSIYRYLHYRGWDHSAGIDAKAQNSPSTGVSPKNAAKAVTVIIGVGAAVVAFFANSPFSEGKKSGYKESRLAMWDRMMKHAKSAGDRRTARFPEKSFTSLAEYFLWMFGKGTRHHFTIGSGTYKTFADSAVVFPQRLSTLEYLEQDSIEGTFLHSGEKVTVEPHLSHLETLQFTQFTGARVRFALHHEHISKRAFLKAIKQNNVEELFSNGAVPSLYIEGRDAGANFPDRELLEVGTDIAQSTVIAPSALQAGLLENLEESYQYIQSFPWKVLGELKDAAMKEGLAGNVGSVNVSDFTRAIVAIARRGLSERSRRLLAYPEYVLQTGKNGADRALDGYNKGNTIQEIVEERHVKI